MLIKVSKISLDQYCKLIDMGYNVVLVESTPSKSPFTQYTYMRPIEPKRIPIRRQLGHVSACKQQHIK